MPKGTRPSTNVYINPYGRKISEQVDKDGYAVGETELSNDAQTRRSVGDQGLDKLNKGKMGTVARPSDKQLTPEEMKAKKDAEKAKADAYSADLVNKVKKAMSKNGGALLRSNYED